MTHPLENIINAPAKDIMDAILAGFRTQIDIKGKLAELYLYRLLLDLQKRGNESYKAIPSYKVEIQKTRNSKDGTNTRSYRVNHFDILAVCLFNQTGKWEFVFINVKDLEKVDGHPEILKIMQRVPIEVCGPWKGDILKVLKEGFDTNE